MTTPELSVVIPCHNEAGNLRPLIAAIHTALDAAGLDYEIVITDDCSTDDSWQVLQEIASSDPRLRAQRFKFNCGESAASWAGMQASRGRYIAALRVATGRERPNANSRSRPASRSVRKASRVSTAASSIRFLFTSRYAPSVCGCGRPASGGAET